MNAKIFLFSLAFVVLSTRFYGAENPAQDYTSPKDGGMVIEDKLQQLRNRIIDARAKTGAEGERREIDEFIAAEGSNIYQELIARIKKGFSTRKKLMEIRCVLARVQPSPADKLIERINGENDAYQKAMLIYCLGAFDGPAVMKTIRSALDDNRTNYPYYRGLEDAPWPVGRVSDEAYLALLPKVQKREGIKVASPIPAWKLPQDDKARERRNDNLKMQLDALHY